MWTDKYRPKSLEDYRGSSSEKEEIREWAEDWEQGDKPVMLHGPAGTGKTSMAEALANDLGYELVETNASDIRTKSKLKEELKEATRQASLLGKKKLILIDEVDGMSSTDRGGTKELNRIVKGTRFPIIMTANDPYDSKIRSLKQKAKMIELGKVHTNSIAAHLRQILEDEGIEYEDGVPKRIARQSDGQLRSAINDLQAVASGKERLEVGDLEAIAARDSEQDIFDALKMVFKTENADTAVRATDNIDEDADTFLQWVRENIPREYTRSEDNAEAYNWISKADLFNGRIRKRMNWKLLKYVYKFSTVGVALSKRQKYKGWTKYQYPSKIRKMGSSHASRRKLESVSGKIGEDLHISVNESKAVLPFVAKLIDRDEEAVRQYFDFDEDDIEFIKGFN